MKIDFKVVAKVRSGDRYLYVLDRKPEFLYTKIDDETIIGECDGMLQFFKRDSYGKNWKAFGGAKFELKLTDGTVEKCYGQWWDGMSKAAKDLFNPEDIVHFSYSTIEELNKFYVYSGSCAIRRWVEKLDDSYKGTVYDYWEFEKLLKMNKLYETARANAGHTVSVQQNDGGRICVD